MVQAGEQTRGTISKNKHNAEIKAIRDARNASKQSREKYTNARTGLKRRSAE